ncbi:ribokinase [Virgibacillus sp. CBA3643]|uniref:ribokinase n=1 Tax=Virgibacillus sp. CBA3643 TaxID=2942278 RepID=UPI0035A2E50E
MNSHPRVCVIGSINMDLVTTTQRMPDKGETIIGEKFETYPGGKGANQAIAAVRLGANVSMIGAIGNDAFGSTLLTHLKSEEISQEGIKVLPNIATGIATIIVSENDNRIIFSSGANSKLSPEMIENARDVILASDIILLQFEIPMETVQYTVDFAYKHKIPVIVNPAPFQTLPEDILKKVTYLTPNEIEFSSMSKLPLIDSIKEKIIVTRGGRGVDYAEASGRVQTIPAYNVKAKDTTGAGDTFNGALATELARGSKLDKAIDFANAAAALSVERLGAQGGMPGRQEVIAFKDNYKEELK